MHPSHSRPTYCQKILIPRPCHVTNANRSCNSEKKSTSHQWRFYSFTVPTARLFEENIKMVVPSNFKTVIHPDETQEKSLQNLPRIDLMLSDIAMPARRTVTMQAPIYYRACIFPQTQGNPHPEAVLAFRTKLSESVIKSILGCLL